MLPLCLASCVILGVVVLCRWLLMNMNRWKMNEKPLSRWQWMYYNSAGRINCMALSKWIATIRPMMCHQAKDERLVPTLRLPVAGGETICGRQTVGHVEALRFESTNPEKRNSPINPSHFRSGEWLMIVGSKRFLFRALSLSLLVSFCPLNWRNKNTKTALMMNYFCIYLLGEGGAMAWFELTGSESNNKLYNQ